MSIHTRSHAFVARAVFAAILTVMCAGGVAQAQSSFGAGTDLNLHKFQPRVSPELAAQSATDKGYDANGISHFALSQMQSLQQEKEARTPAQQKIDSNVLYTLRMLQGQDAAPGVAFLDTGIDLDGNNNIVVDIVANVSENLLNQLRSAGANVLEVNAPLRAIRAIIAPGKIEGIAASPEVIFVSPMQEAITNRLMVPKSTATKNWKLSPQYAARVSHVRQMLASQMQKGAQPNVAGTPLYPGQGSVASEGDRAHQTYDARNVYGVTGAGLKIGVLSNGVTTMATSQATGDLPPTCGVGVSSPCLTVLAGQTGSGDEGTAMLEIVRDMVPGADLYFATANSTPAQFATNIRALRTAGCNIIVDDVFYYVETPFQDGQTSTVVSPNNAGIIAQAVNDVVADGAFYFSSAGNEGGLDIGTSGTWEGDFSPLAAATPLPTTGTVHSFNGVGYDTITSAGSGVAILFWSDPLGASANDYDLYILNSTSTSVLASSTNVQTGTQDPYERAGSTTNLVAGNRLVVYAKAGAAARFIHLGHIRGTLAVGTFGETHGHGAASGAYTVAATPALTPYSTATPTGPYPGPFIASDQIETFTSDGLRRIFFNADSSPITPGNVSSTGGKVLNKPEITAADGVSVTGVGGFGSPFYGTSAAAPSAASVAALVLAAKPTITAAAMKTALTSTAIDIMGPGFDRNSGSGIVMALPAIASLGVTGGANPAFGSITATENPGDGNGVIEAGEGALLSIQLKNDTGVAAATGITATLTSSTAGVIIKQPATSAYADLAAGAGPTSNVSPFLFELPANFGCSQTVQFSLTVSYSSGQTRVLPFTVGVNTVSITNTLGSTPTVPTGLTFATGTQTSRISRSGVVSACGTAKAYPGAVTGANHAYDSYTFNACTSTCFSPQLNGGSAGVNLFEAMYTPSFTPSNLATGYAGDTGQSGTIASMGLNITAGTNYSVVVADVNGNPPSTGIPNTYTLNISSCALKCGTVYPLPIALVHNVTVNAAVAGGTAAASIDNGSNDPNGGPITITQSPAGPYAIGTTSVTLTVTNKYGAFAQATATVTVKPPPVAPTITWNPTTLSVFQNDAIGSGALNATSNASGVFAYTATPTGGSATSITSATVLPVGSYTLALTFTPDDPTSYTSQPSTLGSTFTVKNQELFITNSGGSVLSTFHNGASQSGATAGGGTGAAIDANGFVWSINTNGSSVSKFTGAGAFGASYSGGGITNAKALAIDGNGWVWTVNGNGTVSALRNTGAATSTNGYAAAGGISTPASISVDTAGSLWIANSGNNSVTEVIGVAAPVQAPAVQQVISANPGTRP